MVFYLILSTAFCISCRSPQDIEAFLKELHKVGKLNGNALIVRNDSVIYEKSFGYADGTRQSPLTSEYRFGIGSIYKEFPAVAIMQLEEEGRLTLEDRLSRFLPHLPTWAKEVSIKHLLQYSSGLPKIDWQSYFQQEVIVNEDNIVQDLSHLEKLTFEPGTDYLYSNYNPFLLMRIVETVANTKFEKYIEQKISTPFELGGIVIEDGYPYRDTNLMAPPINEKFEEDDYAIEVTNICSSAISMYRWFNQLDNFAIISKASMKQLSEEAIPENNIQAPLGRCDWKNDNITLHLHHGSSGNYESLVRNYPQDNLTIVLLTNQKHGNLHDMADMIYELARQ